MNVFTENQRKRIARNIRKGLDTKFAGHGRSRRLANLLGVSPSTVSRWINGVGTPELENLSRMAAAFDIPLHRLCGYSGNHPVRTDSTTFNNIMNLSIELERINLGANGADKATRTTMERVGKILAGILETR